MRQCAFHGSGDIRTEGHRAGFPEIKRQGLEFRLWGQGVGFGFLLPTLEMDLMFSMSIYIMS